MLLKLFWRMKIFTSFHFGFENGILLTKCFACIFETLTHYYKTFVNKWLLKATNLSPFFPEGQNDKKRYWGEKLIWVIERSIDWTVALQKKNKKNIELQIIHNNLCRQRFGPVKSKTYNITYLKTLSFLNMRITRRLHLYQKNSSYRQQKVATKQRVSRSQSEKHMGESQCDPCAWARSAWGSAAKLSGWCWGTAWGGMRT